MTTTDTEDIEIAVAKKLGYFITYYVVTDYVRVEEPHESERDAWKAAIASAKEGMEEHEWNALIEAQKAKEANHG